MTDEMLDKLVDVQRDEYEEYFERKKIEDGCCECGDISEYEFQGECFCSECLEDFLIQKFNEDYSVRDKAEMLGLNVTEV